MTKPTLAQLFALPPAVPDSVQSVAIDLIDVPEDRLRPVDPDWAAALASQIAAGVKLPPITLRPADGGRFWLVIGGHRLEAHRLAGRGEIAADIDDLSAAEARLAEIHENLYRHELSILDRALSLAERDRVLKELYPEARRGGDRKSQAHQEKIKRQSLPFDLAENIEAKIGLSDRSIRQAVSLARSLAPESIRALRGTYLADHGADLQALARLRPDQQLFAVQAILQGEARTLKDSLRALGRGPAPADEQERLFQQFLAAWGRMNAKTRRRVTDQINHGDKGNAEAAPQEPAKDE